MSLQNLRSIFQEELEQRVEDFISDSSVNTQFTSVFQGDLSNNTDIYINNRPGAFDTKFNLSETPLIPLGALGESPLEGKSWETLYNADHTPKDGVGYSYTNVNRDKLDIRANNAQYNLYSPSRTPLAGIGSNLLGLLTLGGDFTGEPYIVSNIGDVGRAINSPLTSIVTDKIRLAKFLSSPQGIEFYTNQNLLGLQSKVQYPIDIRRGSSVGTNDGNLTTIVGQSTQRFKPGYSPLSTINSLMGVKAFDKNDPVFGAKDVLLNSSNEYPNFTTGAVEGDGASGVDFLDAESLGNVAHDINLTFGDLNLKKEGFSGFNMLFGDVQELADINDQRVNGNKAGLRSIGDHMTLAPMIKGDILDTSTTQTTSVTDDESGITNSFGANIDEEREGIPFYFKDLRDKSYIFFRAYIEGLSESVSPTWNPTNYIGRSEPVYTYERAEREIQFTLKLVAQSYFELYEIYKKMDKLTSLCYPQYVDEDNPDTADIREGYGNRMKPPLTKFRMGEMFGKTNSELMGFIKSLSYSVEQSSTWETRVGSRVPRHVTVSIGYQVIHANVPNLETKFYGINYDGVNNG